jgi:hypothetical protein
MKVFYVELPDTDGWWSVWIEADSEKNALEKASKKLKVPIKRLSIREETEYPKIEIRNPGILRNLLSEKYGISIDEPEIKTDELLERVYQRGLEDAENARYENNWTRDPDY